MQVAAASQSKAHKSTRVRVSFLAPPPLRGLLMPATSSAARSSCWAAILQLTAWGGACELHMRVFARTAIYPGPKDSWKMIVLLAAAGMTLPRVLRTVRRSDGTDLAQRHSFTCSIWFGNLAAFSFHPSAYGKQLKHTAWAHAVDV